MLNIFCRSWVNFALYATISKIIVFNLSMEEFKAYNSYNFEKEKFSWNSEKEDYFFCKVIWNTVRFVDRATQLASAIFISFYTISGWKYWTFWSC